MYLSLRGLGTHGKYQVFDLEAWLAPFIVLCQSRQVSFVFREGTPWE